MTTSDCLPNKLRYALLQIRNGDDPMKPQEVRCFADALRCDAGRIIVRDLLIERITAYSLQSVDIVLIGGAGHYSVAAGGAWLPRALDVMRRLHGDAKPTFASCWGFQAMARALGGQVVTDLSRAEVGSHRLFLTEAGQLDPVMGPLAAGFWAQMGHQDIVDRLPDDAVLLASSNRVANQAFRFQDKPIYCTQFHPELSHDALMQRVRTYPEYVERIAQMPVDEFAKTLQNTSECTSLLPRFVWAVVRGLI
jgi:GMP synthase (glutamine-hydrolysing)